MLTFIQQRETVDMDTKLCQPIQKNNGQKEVWVNCFCQLSGDNKWKTEVVHVADGGNCYFNFKINLTTKTCYDFAVNGVA